MELPTVGDIYPVKKNKINGTYGVEVEVEFTPGFDGVGAPKGWKTHTEHSLRNGTEYVFASPVHEDKMISMVGELYDILDATGQVDWKSVRTSVHTHINVQNETILDVYKYITAYYLLENLLLNYVEERRRGNLFCLDVGCAENIAQNLREDISKRCMLRFATDGQAIRYSSLNLNAIPKFNSVEFRSLHGGASKQQVVEWSRMLYRLLVGAKSYKNPAAIVDAYFSYSPLYFVRSLLPNSFIEKVAIPGWTDQIESNLGVVANFAYATNWDKWSKQVSSSVKKKKPAEVAEHGFDDLVDVEMEDWLPEDSPLTTTTATTIDQEAAQQWFTAMAAATNNTQGE